MKFLKTFKTDRSETLTEADFLLAYYQKGELRTLGKLYQPYMDMVFSVCYKYLKDEDESKDAVMQIFEKLVVDLRMHQVGNFKSWLHRVTVNFCLMQLRARRVFASMDEIDESSQVEITDVSNDLLILDNNLISLERCIETLNREQRISIHLFFKEEKCYREISSEMGFDVNKVKSYIQNGKRNLKICMDKNGNH